MQISFASLFKITFIFAVYNCFSKIFFENITKVDNANVASIILIPLKSYYEYQPLKAI